jgi:hypothetical protein
MGYRSGSIRNNSLSWYIGFIAALFLAGLCVWLFALGGVDVLREILIK